jgi:hypothetical protein
VTEVPLPGAPLDEWRAYAERVSQETGMATVIVVAGGGYREYVVAPDLLRWYTDQAGGALAEALRMHVSQPENRQ